jgi:hypothetical protein
MLGILGLLAVLMGVAVAKPRIFFAQISSLKLFLLVGSIFLSVGISELVLRLFFAKQLAPPHDERSLLYEYHPTFGWFPPKNTTRRFAWDRTTTITHNSHGFRSPEPETNNKPGIMFLGDSFTWGFDVEAYERFTDKLQSRHPEWQIHNLGVSGYGTDQEFLLLQSYFDVYTPRAVILVYCTDNDWRDNSCNMRYGGYYKPFYAIVGPNALALQGIPVPRAERAILADHKRLARSYLFRLGLQAYWKNRKPEPLLVKQNPTLHILAAMRTFVLQKGGVFAVAMQEKNEDFEQFLTDLQIPWVILATTNKFPGLGGHWNPEGHTDVCNKIDTFLKAGLQGDHIKF